MTTIITGLWGSHVQRFTGDFSQSLRQRCPDVPVWLFIDGPYIPPCAAAQIFPMAMCEGWTQFRGRHENHARAQGRSPTPKWKRSDIEGGYSFRFDAYKWGGQAFVPEAAAAHLPDGELLIWLDADVIATKDIPKGFFEDLVGDHDGAYLGRGRKHSEIGYWAVRLSPVTRPMLSMFADLYRDDTVFELGEWHSAYVWDHCRRAAEQLGNARFRDLTPGGHDHVWFQSPLGLYMDHRKGEARKRRGFSAEARR